MTDISVRLGGHWKTYVTGALPFGATAIGVVSRGGGDSGALVRTALGYYQVNSKTIRDLPQGPTEASVMRAAIEVLPQLTGQRGGRSGRGEAKVRGDSAYYKALRARRRF